MSPSVDQPIAVEVILPSATEPSAAPRVRRNIVANFVGSGWSAVMSIAFVPIYIRLMGPESYGLVGVYVTISAVLAMLDLGLSATANRELARLGQSEVRVEGARLVRTLETVFWVTAAAIGLLAWTAAPFASAWLRPEVLDDRTMFVAAGLLGVAIAVQWPVALYTGSLIGLQRQVALNVLLLVVSTVRGAGAVLILWLVSPTIAAFFFWHIMVGFAHSLAARAVLWRRIDPAEGGAVADWTLLRRHWRFGAGVTVIYGVGLVMTQLDKVVLSRMLPLETFGFYALASIVAASLYRLVAPIAGAVYPRLTQFWAQRNRADLVNLYHLGCQTVTAAVVPIVAVLALFPEDVLWAWTSDARLVAVTAPLLRPLAIGVGLHSAMTLPVAMHLAHGKTKLIAAANLMTAIVLGPALVLAAHNRGAVGAATVWAVVNGAYLMLAGTFVHRSVMPEQVARWFVNDLLLPAGASVAVVLLWKTLLGGNTVMPWVAVWLALAVLSALAAAVIVAPQLRGVVVESLRPHFRLFRSAQGRADTSGRFKAP